jgi:ribose transport system ATP-binding protein
VAKSIKDYYPKEDIPIGADVFSVQDLSSQRGEFEDVSFGVRQGEILGIAGVVGSGKSELGRVIFGLSPKKEGEIRLEGTNLEIRSPRDAIRNGIVLIPEDRREHGIIGNLSVEENIALPNTDDFDTVFGWIKRKQTKKAALDYTKKLAIRTPSINQLTQYLSGGNQQKVVVAKWLCSQARVFIFAEITAGIDVGAKTEIYRLLGEICKAGGAVILISSEFEELLGMCDRILVLFNGRQLIEREVSALNLRSLLRYAVGGGHSVDQAGQAEGGANAVQTN